MNDILFLKKHSQSCACWPKESLKQTLQELSVERIMQTYQGFDGELVTICPSVAEAEKIHPPRYSRGIYVDPELEKLPESIEKSFVLLGYDVGICQPGHPLHSSILHDVLFGEVEELLGFYECLNNNTLLFPTRILASNYLRFYRILLQESAMAVYTVWRFVKKRNYNTFYNPETGAKWGYDDPPPAEIGIPLRAHWHHYNPDKTGKHDHYIDAQGNPCSRKSPKCRLYSESSK